MRHKNEKPSHQTNTSEVGNFIRPLSKQCSSVTRLWYKDLPNFTQKLRKK